MKSSHWIMDKEPLAIFLRPGVQAVVHRLRLQVMLMVLGFWHYTAKNNTIKCYAVLQCFRCENKHPNATECELWALQGQCDTNFTFMITYCTKTCLNCDQSDIRKSHLLHLESFFFRQTFPAIGSYQRVTKF